MDNLKYFEYRTKRKLGYFLLPILVSSSGPAPNYDLLSTFLHKALA